MGSAANGEGIRWQRTGDPLAAERGSVGNGGPSAASDPEAGGGGERAVGADGGRELLGSTGDGVKSARRKNCWIFCQFFCRTWTKGPSSSAKKWFFCQEMVATTVDHD